MPSYCCISGCDGNKPNGSRVSVFKFPSDPETLQKWLDAVSGKGASLMNENSKVCQKHFKLEDIITETSAYDSKRKVTITVPLKNFRLKSCAVPCIFEDCPVKPQKKVKKSSLKDSEEKRNIDSDVETSVPRKQSKSPLSSGNTADDAKEESPSKVSPTTDRPIIAVIKAEDTLSDKEMSPEKIDSNNCSNMEESSQTAKSLTLSSPFKNLPVGLKDEERVSGSKELKSVKRSLSTGSNSSTGSSDVQKSLLLMKRRKIEKPAPVVLGRQNDCYCWVCHRENISLTCIGCPRAYHLRCAGEGNSQLSPNTSDWVCPECQHNLAAENEDTRSSTLSEIPLDKLGQLLKLSLNKMKLRAPIAFHQPVSLDHYPKYLHYVIHPMDFSLLEKNIKERAYGSTEAFLADVKWIFHNSCVFNGTQHPLSTNAKNLVKSCDMDMQEIEVCPDCFVHSVLRNKYWFSEVCRKPHPLVWAKLKGFPYWPAKVVRIVDGNVDARFFGAHDRAWVPVSQCYHLSKEMPTTSKPKKKGNYEVALDELNVHVHFLMEKFGCFEYAPCRTHFNPEDKTLMYHGIDLDKINKEDITIDSNPQRDLNRVNFGKGSRFSSFSGSAEFEKSSANETKLSENQTETQCNQNLDKIEMNSPSFIIKQRISTDSNFSEKDASANESNSIVLSKSIKESKSTNESDSVNESKLTNEIKSTNKSELTNESKSTNELTVTDLPSADELKSKAQIKDTDVLLGASKKESDKASDSNQLRKLELALERIKGYVSLSIDTEKEDDMEGEENKTKDENVENEKDSSEDKEKIEKPKVLSPLFKDFPITEMHKNQEVVEDVNVALEANKKTDSFFLKLNETIESCKAKLGISEIVDDLSSDESAMDDNASKSDEDEETTASEEEEEISEDDADEVESEEVSDEEIENKTNSESDKEDSELSDTDVESSNDISPKKTRKTNLSSTDDKKEDAKEITFKNMNIACGNSIKSSTNDSSEAIITNPDMEVPEVTIDASGAAEVTDENSSSSSNDVKRYPEFSAGEQEIVSKNFISSQESVDECIDEAQSNSSEEVSKDERSNIECVKTMDSNSSYIFNVNKNSSPFKNVTSNVSPLKEASSQRESIDRKSEDIKSNRDAKQNEFLNKGAVFSSPCKNQPQEDDDDDDEILIYTPTKPKSPPVIVLDDDQENENSSVSDTFAIKSPPYSTSVDSLSNEEQTNSKANSGDDPDGNTRKSVVNNDVSHEEIIQNDEVKDVNINSISNTKNDEVIKKRKFHSDSSSEDEDIQVVTPVKRPVLTGAIRTFNKPSLKPATPTVESVKRNLEKESLNPINKSPDLTEDSGKEANSSPSPSARSHLSSPSAIERLLKSPVDTSNLSDKDKEIFYLKSKLNCVLTAYQIQSWKCSQEREELRHNMNLLVMEMRASLESDKKQAVESLSKKFEQEKQKIIEDAKRKQWCAWCLMESRYACCWNTSYCSVDCQKRHFNEHRHSCSQLKSRSEALELKQKSAAGSENNENKKLIILNMKQTKLDSSQQISVSKSHIQMKQPLQIASSSNNIQFVLAPVKSTPESAITTSTASISSLNSKEPALDSAQIINQVRNKSCNLGTAITILRKKNREAVTANKTINEEEKQSEANLEDIYFPSPPRITFEGYESATPDPTIVLENDELNEDTVLDPDDLELPNDASLEPDIVLSDTDDKDNEMVSIGYGIEMKAKFLNKCLVYGQTAKKLTRCLVDVIFPDLKLLGSCSAFGQMSNVTKLTRTALPTRKVHAIIDYVRKRFPDTLRREIVLQINMKCKEARVMLNKRDSEQKEKKTTGRRLLAREKEDELTPTGSKTTSTSISTPMATSATVSSSSNVGPSVVCVQGANSNVFTFNVPNTSPAPNILQCKKQILIKPKLAVRTVSQPIKTVHQPILKTVGNAAILQSPPRKRDTVRNLLAANKVKLQDSRKLSYVMAVESSKAPTPQPLSLSTTNVRPYIILGSQKNSLKSLSPTSVQPPSAVPSSSSPSNT